MLTFNKAELQDLIDGLHINYPLQLVHDQGVYIMCKDQLREFRVIVYAHGCHPEKDPDWWHTSARLVGGDDFGETLCTVGELVKLLKAARQHITVTLTEKQMVVEAR